MIILGFVLAILGYWLLPELLPEAPARIDNLVGVAGRTMVLQRVVKAPRAVVWGAWMNPETLPQPAEAAADLVKLCLPGCTAQGEIFDSRSVQSYIHTLKP